MASPPPSAAQLLLAQRRLNSQLQTTTARLHDLHVTEAHAKHSTAIVHGLNNDLQTAAESVELHAPAIGQNWEEEAWMAESASTAADLVAENTLLVMSFAAVIPATVAVLQKLDEDFKNQKVNAGPPTGPWPG